MGKRLLVLSFTFVFLIAGSVLADWDPGDGHKMHYPQLPDEEGWNVNATFPMTLGDDWECSETGPVSDIHFWGSWKEGLTGTILGFQISIYSDIPAWESPTGYSMPGVLLWDRYFDSDSFTIRFIDPGIAEGWYDPSIPEWFHPDHYEYFQYNIFNIEDPFIQTEGDTFWLVISADVLEDIPERIWGWKSSIDHWNDDAVWDDFGPPYEWQELYEPPYFLESMDLSFVITTEEEFGACCLDDGSCQNLSQANCMAIPNAQWKGPGTMCLGDFNPPNGIDDACEDPWNCTDNPPPGKNGGGSETESNNTCATANAAQCEYAYCGNINPDTDEDWWEITLPEDTCYCLHVRLFADDTPGQYAYGQGLNPELTIYEDDCVTQLFYNDNKFGLYPDAEGEDAQYDCFDAGNCHGRGTTLYIKVSGENTTTGPYLLVVNCFICECPDSDGDGIPDEQDNCPNKYNPLQEDADLDNIGDSCDNCINNYNPSQEDVDTDGVGDSCDNCIYVYNPDQADSDGDGIGDACEIDTCDYYKAAYVDYAPNGMPDFDQKQNTWYLGVPPSQQWTHCGPAALADCFWWFDSKFEPNPVDPRPFYPGPGNPPLNDGYPLVQTYDPATLWDDHDTLNVMPFIDSLALYCRTNVGSSGTSVFDMANGAQNWLFSRGLGSDYSVTVYPIDEVFGFEGIRNEVMASQDVILLLGFWQETAPGVCERIGGHYVTCAGVCTNPEDSAICISDPYFDMHEGEPPAGSAHGSSLHNDAWYISGPHGTIHHDRYVVDTLTACNWLMPPFFTVELPNYPVTPGNVINFAGMNDYDTTMVPVPPMGLPIHTVIEFAVVICPDKDGDGIPDDSDNCPDVYNPSQENSDNDSYGDSCDNCPFVDNEDQADMDGDGIGDVCDNDIDGDGYNNDVDNCPTVYNPSQTNSDSDSLGNACDNCPNVDNNDQANSDADSLGNVCDNCPNVDNDDQANSDADSLGNVCDNCPNDDNNDQANSDADTYGDVCDNCPNNDNENQANSDTDSHGDSCDNCLNDDNEDQADMDGDGIGDVCDEDKDGDGYNNDVDNCPDNYNPDQSDIDSDGIGDVCDDDIDGDGVLNGVDNCPYVANSGQEDNDSDGDGDVCDSDDDNDGVLDVVDNCPFDHNPTQEDADSDSLGDVCDPDDDNDGILDDGDGSGTIGDNPCTGGATSNCDDNCQYTDNPGQEDANSNGVGDVCEGDADGDGILDGDDNCPYLYNPGQEDNDGDDNGDVCDPDDDNDGIYDVNDNCPYDANSGQEDNDGDGLGDVCDPDDDNDTVLDGSDNCPFDYNPGQEDADSDGEGDVCDTDDDGDGVLDVNDNCPYTYNPGQEDADSDGIGDACEGDRDGDGVIDDNDNCIDVYNPGQANHDYDALGDACDPDDDNDGVLDGEDNCPFVYNPTQRDTDGDGQGDACDADDDADGILDDGDGSGLAGDNPCTGGETADCDDNCPLVPNPGQEDADNDGIGDACESGTCDCKPGDADGTGIIEISDAVYIVNYVFIPGSPAPTPYALCSGDADCNCIVEISDAVFLINYIFVPESPAPCECEAWLINCGEPLRQ